MATFLELQALPPAENAATAYANITAQLALVSSSLLPNITVDGVTIDRISYYKFLVDAQKAALEAMQKAAGPFTVISVAR